jgi:hypothetical protein
MSEKQTTFQRFEEQTKKTIEKTIESIQNILDKMRNKKLGLDETEQEEFEAGKDKG